MSARRPLKRTRETRRRTIMILGLRPSYPAAYVYAECRKL